MCSQMVLRLRFQEIIASEMAKYQSQQPTQTSHWYEQGQRIQSSDLIQQEPSGVSIGRIMCLKINETTNQLNLKHLITTLITQVLILKDLSLDF